MRVNLTCILVVLMLIMLNGFLSAQHVVIMSFNIRYDNPGDGENAWDKRKTKLLEYLNTENPDVLCIQEGLEHQVNYLDTGLVNYAYFGVGRNDGESAGEYAAVFYDSTRCDLLESGTFWLSQTPDEPSLGWDASLPRICTYGRLYDKRSDTAFFVFNAHYDHLGAEARKHSSERILDKIQAANTEHNPCILAGDFNALYHEEPVQKILNKMDYARDISDRFAGPDGTINSFGNAEHEKCIDYIFVDGFYIKTYQHVSVEYDRDKYLSDHRPVIATGQFIYPQKRGSLKPPRNEH